MRTNVICRGLLAGLLLVGTGGCITRQVDSIPPSASAQTGIREPARPNNQVDILFVVDNSGSMAEEQENIGRNFRTFVENLKDDSGQPLDYRIAVVSTDVGSGGFQVDSSPFNVCNASGPEGDAGKLQRHVHSDPSDWEASSFALAAICNGDDTQKGLCDQLKQNRQWLSDNCDGMELDPSSPWLTPHAPGAAPGDAPRSDEEISRQFRCIGSLGINGCFVEQPLEAARRALRDNPDFLRKEAFLAVIFLTDETDCSLKDPALLDPADRTFSTEDVALRCYVDAVQCTGESDLGGGFSSFQSCSDTGRWLNPVDEYVDFLRSLKAGSTDAASKIIVAGIMGNPDYTQAPSDQGTGPLGVDIAFALDRSRPNFARQAPSCASNNGVAAPNPRLMQLLNAFPDVDSRPTFVSICSDDFAPVLEQLGGSIRDHLKIICVQIPDAAAESDPNRVCALDELGPDGSERRPSISSQQGWRIEPGSPNCANRDTAKAEITIEPALRDSFAVDSLIQVTCAQ